MMDIFLDDLNITLTCLECCKSQKVKLAHINHNILCTCGNLVHSYKDSLDRLTEFMKKLKQHPIEQFPVNKSAL